MVERVGEWYAFARDAVCRRLTLYDAMAWHTPPPYLTQQHTSHDQSGGGDGALLYMFGPHAVHAVAPYGGRVAALRAASGHAGPSSALQEDLIDVYTSAGAWQACCTSEARTGKVIALAWTREDELCALTDTHYVLLYDLRWVAARRPGGSGDGPCMPTRTTQLCPSPALPIQAHYMNAEGVLCVDRTGEVRGMLCGRDGTLRPLTPFNVRIACDGNNNKVKVEEEGGESAHEAATSLTPVVTAVDFVPCDWNAEGCAVVYWAQRTTDAATTRKDVGRCAATSVVCAVVLHESAHKVLQRAESTDHGDGVARQVRVRGAVHALRVCHADLTQLLVLTTHGLLLVVSSDLAAVHFALDFAGRQAVHTMPCADSAVVAPLPPGANAKEDDEAAAVGVAEADGAEEERGSNAATTVMNNSSLALSFAKDELQPQGSPPVAATHTNNNNNNNSLAINSVPQREPLVEVHLPSKAEWCGRDFVMLHYNSHEVAHSSGTPFSLLICTQGGVDVRCERLEWGSITSPSSDESQGVMSVSEVDGVRVLTGEACYLVQCVSHSLRHLCRVQPPLSTEARVVRVYQALMQREQQRQKKKSKACDSAAMRDMARLMAEAPRLLHKPWPTETAATYNERKEDDDGSGSKAHVQTDDKKTKAQDVKVTTPRQRGRTTCEMFDCLVQCASEELDTDRQALLLGAAMCLVTHIAVVPAAELADMRRLAEHVTRQLRLLHALRVERSHMPLTAPQLRALAGSTAPSLAHRYANDEAAVWSEELRRGTRVEASVVLGRLTHCGHFVLAYDVAVLTEQPLHGVLAQWCGAWVCGDAGRHTDAELHARLAAVLRAAAAQVRASEKDKGQQQQEMYGDCYLHAALAAARCHRAALSLQFALEAPTGAAQVLWLMNMGEFALAVVCAARGGTADGVHVSLQALLAHETAELRAQPGQARAMKGSSARCLLASPRALQVLLHGAPWLTMWHKALVALMLTCSSDPEGDVCGVLSALMAHHRLRAALVQGSAACLSDADAQLPAAGCNARGVDWAELRAVMQRAAELQHKHSNDDDNDDDDDDASGTVGSTAQHPTQKTRDAHELRWPSTRDEPLLQPPGTALAEEVRWLRRQERLAAMQQDYALRYADPRFTSECKGMMSVTDVMARLIFHDAKEEARHVQRLFAVPARKARYATLTGHCAAGRWSAVEDCLSPPPASSQRAQSSPFALLSQVRSFASSHSSSSNNKTTGSGALPSRAVVRLLHQHGQDALAAQYVPGMEADFDEKLQWYSALRAPLRALREAMEVGEAGLVRQVLHRFASEAEVQRVGHAYLAQLAEEEG